MNILRNYLRFIVGRRRCRRCRSGCDAGDSRRARRVDHVRVDILVVGLLRWCRRGCGSRLRAQISSCLKARRKAKSELEHGDRECVGAASAFGLYSNIFNAMSLRRGDIYENNEFKVLFRRVCVAAVLRQILHLVLFGPDQRIMMIFVTGRLVALIAAVFLMTFVFHFSTNRSRHSNK